MVDVLVAGTHPDDIELGFGGAVAGLVSLGHGVALLDLTNGEPTPFGDPETRALEARRAADILGVKTRITLDLPNRELQDTIAARHAVAAVYRRLRPDILFIQDKIDAHPDHIAGHAIALKARFDAKLTKTDIPGDPWYPKRVYHYVASHLRLHVSPSFILDVSETFETKLDAVRAYESQFKAAGKEEEMIGRLRRIGAYFGQLIGAEYGEPVISPEPAGLRDIRDLTF